MRAITHGRMKVHLYDLIHNNEKPSKKQEDRSAAEVADDIIIGLSAILEEE